MLKHVLDDLHKMARDMSQDRGKIATTALDDPIAIRIDWLPLAVQQTTGWEPRNGAYLGAKFSNPIQVNPYRLEFRQLRIGLTGIIGVTIFALFFAAFGVLALTSGGPPALMGLPFLGSGIFVLIGVAISLVSWLFFHSLNLPSTFDKSNGFYWRNKRAPHRHPDIKYMNNACKLEDIHALQLTRLNYQLSPQHRYAICQLNLVLKSGRRLNVLAQEDEPRTRLAAEALAAFLSKPLWDAL